MVCPFCKRMRCICQQVTASADGCPRCGQPSCICPPW